MIFGNGITHTVYVKQVAIDLIVYLVAYMLLSTIHI